MVTIVDIMKQSVYSQQFRRWFFFNINSGGSVPSFIHKML